MRWVKLARKKGIPYFEDLPTLEPNLLPAIECEQLQLITIDSVPFEEEQLVKDREALGKDYWREEFTWNLEAWEVALAQSRVFKGAGPDPRKMQKLWQEELRKGNSSLLRGRLGKTIKDCTDFLHKREWDILMKDLEKNRKHNRAYGSAMAYDSMLASLGYYNEDTSEEEMKRRWGMLNLSVVEKTVEQCNAWALAPRPESWHKVKKIAFTEEMWDSVCSKEGFE
jgi:hypothetical protein